MKKIYKVKNPDNTPFTPDEPHIRNKSSEKSEIPLTNKKARSKKDPKSVKVRKKKDTTAIDAGPLENDGKYRELYDYAPCGYISLSKGGKILDLNLNGAMMLDKEPASLLGGRFESLLAKKSLPVFTNFLQNIFKSDSKESCEVIMNPGQGKHIHVHLTGSVNPSGKQCFITMVDITRRKDLEDKVKISDQRLLFHLENSPLALVEWDANLVVTQWSAEAERLFGWTKSETLNKPINDLNIIYEEDIPIVERTIKQLTSGEEITVVSSNRNYTKDGNIIECMWYNSTLVDENGQMSSVMSLVEDITARKKIEQTQLFLLGHYRSVPGENFFESLAEYLARVLDMDYVCIDRLHGDLLSARTVAVYFDGKFEDNVDYTLKETPCGDVVGRTICCFPKGVRHLFLKDQVLQDMRAESYIGTTLYSYSGEPIGLIAVIGRKPMRNQPLAESILKLVGIRASGELERISFEDELKNLASYPRLNPNPIIEMDLEGNLHYSNPAAREVFPGIDEKGSDQKYFNDWKSIIDNLQKKKSRKIPLETRIKDRYFLHTLHFVDELNRVRIYSTDITKRKIYEEQLRHINEILEARVKKRTEELVRKNAALQTAEEKYRTIANFTYDWEYWVNPDGKYNYVSPSCLRITGYSPEEFIEDKDLILKIIHPDDREGYSAHSQNQPHTDNDIDFEFRIITKDGKERWIAHVCQPVYGSDGEYLGQRGSNRDITEKLKAEQDLLNISFEVEERERTNLSRELHDGLGPLLSTVKLYFQWLAETDDPEKAKVIIEKGNINIDRAIQTAREVAHGLSPIILNNFGYVEAVLIFTQSINDTKKIKIDFIYNSKDRFNLNLETILYRTTTELINNALNHSRANRIEIEYNYNTTLNMITFTYFDDGVGFDLDHVEKQSKGLGLVNLKNRINSFKGSMRIVTAHGRGTKVFIELPLIVADN